MSRRVEVGDGGEVDNRGFYDSPLGWIVTFVAVGAFVVVFVVSELAALLVGVSLLAVELVDQLRQRGRPWLVEAKAHGSQHDRAWRVPGRRRSKQVAHEVARALERGDADIDPAGATRL